ncbi:DUF928 domain-containing protein [Microcoleus sp. FACHB-SPT15]|uniref:DUF928 domain-containing protein n=1 Tax=Microcoleus sp. FACHB-SPT15 TaxID=2692830 RepID=UPI0017861D36|nr:DUF928 domain-containing protein [Microcoleus sp. FACHB-SPT15]MBD1809832.1 DUF928 domain-containing protein [Microcoleus sp. FACHB-SPT15]
MAWFKRSSRFTIITAALMLGLSLNVVAQPQPRSTPVSLSNRLENAFRPPSGIGKPVNRQQGATRGPCMTKASKPLIALVPVDGAGETMAENPTVFWYMPEISADAPAPAVEFVLKDANDQEIYTAEYTLTTSAQGVVGAPGIMSLSVSNLYPLEMGREYHWELTLMCNSKDSDRSEDLTVFGMLKRVAPDPNLALRVQQASPQERVGLYADKKLWYETVAALVELRRDRPYDSNITAAWRTLLSSVGLEVIAQEPVIQSARNTSN